MAMPVEKVFIIVTNDEKTFKVREKIVRRMVAVGQMLDDLASFNTASEEENKKESGEKNKAAGGEGSIPVNNVVSTTFMKVLEYLDHYEDVPGHYDEKPISVIRNTPLSTWDKSFLGSMDKSQLVDLTLAANYLECKLLLELCCHGVAEIIKGKSTQELREEFGIKNDFTPEEEEKLMKEHGWCEEANGENKNATSTK
jgi:S-phase kinase-associated protein 1